MSKITVNKPTFAPVTVSIALENEEEYLTFKQFVKNLADTAMGIDDVFEDSSWENCKHIFAEVDRHI